jgi:MFS family permease
LAAVLHGRRGRFLLALLLTEFAGAMQGIAYSTVLPVMARDLDGFDLFGATLAAGSVAAVLMLSFTAPILQRVPPLRVLVVATALYVVGAGLAVFAPTLGWVLAGTVVRGVAAGLLAGFGFGAIGALFDEHERPRIFGLYALIWLLPSVLGPPLNAVITDWVGWRWAIGWPAVLVVLGRIMIGLTVSALPWRPEAGPTTVSTRVGVGVALALVVGSWGSASPSGLGLIALIAGIVAGGVAIAVFLTGGMPGAARPLLAFALLCAAFFGVYELLSLTIIEGLGSTVLVASAALTGGLLAWSLVGLRPRPDARPDRAVLGPGLVLVACLLVIAALIVGGGTGLGTAVAGATLGGVGMGAAYPLLSSEPFSADRPAATVGTLIAFAETAATAWAAMLAGGLYSALHGRGWTAVAALEVVFAVLAVIALSATVIAARRRHESP